MLSRIFCLLIIVSTLLGCQGKKPFPDRLRLGVVSFGENEQLEEKYGELKVYLEKELNSIIELEPTYNERQALVQMERNAWDMVFASSGLAAIAASDSSYTAILPLEGGLNNRSIFIVPENSSIKNISQLQGKTIALGQPGSSPGYYVPLYNLYGLTLPKIRLAASPKQALLWMVKGEIDAAAMSLEQYNLYRTTVSGGKFRVLFQDNHYVPSGAILLSNNLPQIQQQALSEVLNTAPPMIPASAGYIANGDVPNYQEMIDIIKKVTSITDKIQQEPAVLYDQTPQ
jgi:phosphonate transport system substrate-binding protein